MFTYQYNKDDIKKNLTIEQIHSLVTELGGFEAPTNIISVYLGDTITKVLEDIASENSKINLGKEIIEFDILKENGIILCETRAEYSVPQAPKPYFIRKEYKYGKIKLALYRKPDEE